MHYKGTDIESLGPVERMAIGTAIHDSALAEIESAPPRLSEAEIEEIDRRTADIDSGRVTLVPWEDMLSRLKAE